MPPSDSTITNNVTQEAIKAIALAPTVIAGMTTVANSVSTDNATHATVIQTATDALGAAVTSLNAIAASGAVGHNDAANIEAGTAIATQAASLATQSIGLIAELEALFKKFF